MKCIKCKEKIEVGGFGRLCAGCFLEKLAEPKSILFILIFVAITSYLFEALSFFIGHNNLVVIFFIVFLLIFLRELKKIISLSNKVKIKRRIKICL